MRLGLGLGLTFGNVISSGGGFSPEYEAILARATALGYAFPSAGVQVLQNTLVKDLVDGGVWDKLDHLKIYAGSNSDFSLINWITPANFLSTKVNSPTYGYAYGFKGNATNAHLQTGFTPSGSLNYKQDDACYFNYRKSENTVGQTQNYMGSFDFVRNVILGSYGINNFETAINAASGVAANYSAGGSTIGLTLLNRENSTQHKVWLNNNLLATATSASTGIPTAEFLTCILNTVIGVISSDAERSMEGAGAALSSGQIATLTNSFATYLAAL